MRSKTIKFLSKVMCLVLVLSFIIEAPAMAAFEAIKVNVGGQQVSVTPGQWISVTQGTQVTNYNVRYVNGQPVALSMSQYTKLIFGGGATTPAVGTTVKPATTGSTAASTVKPTTTTTPSANTGTVANNSAAQATTSGSSAQTSSTVTPSTGAQSTSVGTVANNTAVAKPAAVSSTVSTSGNQTAATPVTSAADTNVTGAAAQTSGAKTSGSFIKNELSEYGQTIKDSFNSGKTSGNEFGNKTVDGVKTGATKVGETVKGAGSKIGDLLKSAKDRISKIFKKNPTPAKGGDSGQSGQTGDQGQSGQTGEQSGQSGQSGDQGQSGQSGQSGDQGQSGQTGDQGQAGQTGQAGQSGQSGQSGQAGQTGAEKPGMMDIAKAKLASGYQAGKVMTKAGFQNVKDSVKSGFSPKNLLMTAGITVGVDLATQIMRGEKPSLAKAVKTVVSAEFAGGVVGSVTGAAAGSFFVPFLTAIPVVGGVLSALAPTFGSVVGGSVGAYLAGDIKNGKFSIKEAFKRVDWIGVGGQTIGSVAGSMLGSFLGPIGTVIGGMVGGYIGNWAAHKIASLFGKDTNPGSLITVGMPVGTNPRPEGDGAISIGGSAEIPVSGDQSVQVSVAADPTVSADATSIGTYNSQIQLADARYQELYKLYNEMLAQGRQADAMKVGQEMNKAKAELDAIKAQ